MNLEAENDHLETMRYVHETVKAEYTEDTMNWAAKYSHLDVVKYLGSICGG